MRQTIRFAVALACGAALACGKSPEQKQAEDLQKAADEMQQHARQVQRNAETLARSYEAMARGIAGGAAGSGDQTPVEPVDFKALQRVLPDMAGWERSTPEGERMTMPVSFSTASVRYTRGDAEVEQKITDSGFNQLLVAPFAMMLTTGYSKETSDGFERATTIAGVPAFEKWDASGKSGELTAFVANRFIVELQGSGLGDLKELRAFMDRTDLNALAGLK